MKVSKYLDVFRALSYPELFSEECLSALKNIQDKYGQIDSNHVIYEINLNDPARTLDFSFKFYETGSVFPYWYEFDYDFYSDSCYDSYSDSASADDIPHGCFIDLTASVIRPSEIEENICRVTGREKFEILREPLNNLENFMSKRRGLRVLHLGNLDYRGYSRSVRIYTRVRTCEKLIRLIRDLSYSGDISLIEDTITKIEPYNSCRSYELSFDIFADRISDKIGVSFYPFTAVKNIRDLINVLTANNFCLYEKGQGLTKWVTDALPEGILRQELNFIKIQFEKDKIVSVKAYLMQSDEYPFEFLLYGE